MNIAVYIKSCHYGIYDVSRSSRNTGADTAKIPTVTAREADVKTGPKSLKPRQFQRKWAHFREKCRDFNNI